MSAGISSDISTQTKKNNIYKVPYTLFHVFFASIPAAKFFFLRDTENIQSEAGSKGNIFIPHSDFTNMNW